MLPRAALPSLTLTLLARPAQKVNEKNSWSLDLINDLGRVIDHGDGEGEMTNFQRASCTLEAGIKIYSYRVDSVYTETFKLMGGLNRTSKHSGQADKPDGEADDAVEGTDGPSVKKKEKTSKRVVAAGTKFIEPNLANLNYKKLELAFDVDPLFHQTSAKFDEGGAKGLLLHNLSVQHGLSLVLDSSDARRPVTAPASALAAPLPLRCISNLIPRNCLELHISREYSEQHEPSACAWVLGAESSRDSARRAPLTGDSDAESDADGADGNDGAAAETASFDGHAPFEEMLDNDFDDDAPVDDRDALLHLQQGEDEGRLAILSLDEMVAEREGDVEQGHEQTAEEIVYRKAQQLLQVGQRWAGPGHWKFNAAPKTKAADVGNRGGKAKSAFVLDFRKRAEALEAVLAMPLEAKGTTLSEAAFSKGNEEDHTLPNDHHCRQRLPAALKPLAERVRGLN